MCSIYANQGYDLNDSASNGIVSLGGFIQKGQKKCPAVQLITSSASNGTCSMQDSSGKAGFISEGGPMGQAMEHYYNSCTEWHLSCEGCIRKGRRDAKLYNIVTIPTQDGLFPMQDM